MVGGFQSILTDLAGSRPPLFPGLPDRGPSRRRRRVRALPLALAVILLPLATSTERAGADPSAWTRASPALASGPNASSAPDSTRPREPRVSTSPDDLSARGRLGSRPVRKMRVARPELPLTRAAVRQQVESISPAAWLEGYGPVTVAQPR